MCLRCKTHAVLARNRSCGFDKRRTRAPNWKFPTQVWIFLTLGAMGLFVITSTVENNENFFPAIYRANRAMKQTE